MSMLHGIKQQLNYDRAKGQAEPRPCPFLAQSENRRFVMVGLLDWSLKNCRSLSSVDWEVGVMDLVGNTMDIKCDAKTCQGKQAAATRTTQTDPFRT